MDVSRDRRPSVEKARFERANSMRPHLQCGAFDQLSHFSWALAEPSSALARPTLPTFLGDASEDDVWFVHYFAYFGLGREDL